MENEEQSPLLPPKVPPTFFQFVPPKNGVRIPFEKHILTEEEVEKILAEPIEEEDPEA